MSLIFFAVKGQNIVKKYSKLLRAVLKKVQTMSKCRKFCNIDVLVTDKDISWNL
jgi:hypothetical protein